MQCWHDIFEAEKKQDDFQFMMKKYHDSMDHSTVYPEENQIFRAFDLTLFSNIKVVILGQDPYHQPGQANGLAFSVPKSEKIPPSLANIFKALASDLNITPPTHGDLTSWAEQGVLLLNCLLSVTHNQPESAKKIGWEPFTNRIIQIISDHHPHIVFLLWGNYAQKKAALIDHKKHLILKSAHPSPLSAYRGFLECKHFSKTNDFLEKHQLKKINWDLSGT